MMKGSSKASKQRRVLGVGGRTATAPHARKHMPHTTLHTIASVTASQPLSQTGHMPGQHGFGRKVQSGASSFNRSATSSTSAMGPRRSFSSPALEREAVVPEQLQMEKPDLLVLHLPRVSPLAMLHLEERLLRKEKGNYLVLNRPLPQHRAVILGVSGKPSVLVNEEQARADNIPLIKRYTGGGTVYIDGDTRFAGFVMNKADVPHVMPYPQDIMKWSSTVHGLAIDYMRETTSKAFSHIKSKSPMEDCVFRLNENDYCINNVKYGGNAQSITRERWVHHTSVLWDFDMENMSKYLKMPDKKPAYRQDRTHDQFLCQLRPFFDPMPDKPLDLTEDYLIEDAEMVAGCKYTDAYMHSWQKFRHLEDLNDEHREQHGHASPELVEAMEQVEFPSLAQYLLECRSKLMVYSSLVGHNNELLNDGIITACNQLFKTQEISLEDIVHILEQPHRHGTYLL